MTSRERHDATLAGLRREVEHSGAPDRIAAQVRARMPMAGTGGVLELAALARRQLFGAGPLEPLLASDDVSDVLVNGPGVVWVDRGNGVVDSGVRIDDERELRALAHRLVTASGRRLDEACPFADARLPDGTRLHAALASVAPQGTTLSLRLPPRQTFTFEDLTRLGTLPADGAELLTRMVRARLSFLVTGGTGTGKTTVLSTLLSQADPAERLVVVEDAPELMPMHPHVVRLHTRPANAEGTGSIALAELVRQALRMRPDRLVVGEVRGPEVVDLLAALNTGHEGGCATLHANAPEQLPARMEALTAAAGLSRGSAHAQLAAGVQAVVHLRREPTGQRRVASIGVLDYDDAGLVHARLAVQLGDDGVRWGPAAASLDRLLAAS